MRARHQQRDDRGSCGDAGVLHVAVVSAADERVTASIDAVIVRDGPGSWSRNADWDEYLMHVRATSGWSVDVTGVVVTDSLGKGHKPSPYRTQLARESKKTAHRYDNEDLGVTAGTGGALFAGGAVVGLQGRQVELEIYRRATEIPVTVAAGADVALDVFIPLAPAPQQVEIRYTNPVGGHVLVIDTRTALAGLHLLPKDGAPPVGAPSPTETR